MIFVEFLMSTQWVKLRVVLEVEECLQRTRAVFLNATKITSLIKYFRRTAPKSKFMTAWASTSSLIALLTVTMAPFLPTVKQGQAKRTPWREVTEMIKHQVGLHSRPPTTVLPRDQCTNFLGRSSRWRKLKLDATFPSTSPFCKYTTNGSLICWTRRLYKESIKDRMLPMLTDRLASELGGQRRISLLLKTYTFSRLQMQRKCSICIGMELEIEFLLRTTSTISRHDRTPFSQ